MKYRHLPKRFWVDTDYEEGEEKFKKSSYGLKSAEFRKIYNKKISPFLRKRGYKASGFKGVKEDDHFYYQVFFGTGKYGGEGTFSILVHPKGFPTKDHYEFTDTKAPHYPLLNYDFVLPNGRQWIRIGRTEEEGQETAQYLLEILERELDQVEAMYQDEWATAVQAMTLDNLRDNYEAFRKKFGLRSYLANYEIGVATHIARFHRLKGDFKLAKNWVDKARVLEIEWAASQEQEPHLRVKLLLDNIVDPNSPIYWTKANSEVFWNRD